MTPSGFRCPRCGKVSQHPADLEEGYCGNCHDWTALRRQQNDRSPDTLSLYAWLSRDQDGVEGIVAAPTAALGVVALVSTDRQRALDLRPAAEMAASMRGFPARLVRFERREDVEVVG